MSLIKFIYTSNKELWVSKQKKDSPKTRKALFMLLLASSPFISRLGIKRFTEPFYLAIG